LDNEGKFWFRYNFYIFREEIFYKMDNKNEQHNQLICDLIGMIRGITGLLRQPAGKRTDLAFQRWHSECVELLDYAEAFLDNEDKQVE